LKRIRALVIPPAWTDVWICPLSNGHIQATARDAKRRKQYRYHARWREVRDEDKYDRMVAFGEALPALRKRVDEDLSQPGLPRSKVMATVVRLLELTLIRVGNEAYARAKELSFVVTFRCAEATIVACRYWKLDHHVAFANALVPEPDLNLANTLELREFGEDKVQRVLDAARESHKTGTRILL
jgi:hypothetical protein